MDRVPDRTNNVNIPMGMGTTGPFQVPDEQQGRIHAQTFEKFGAELLADGYTIIPTKILRYCQAVGMTHVEYMLFETITSFQHDETMPWVGIHTIADSLGKSYRTIERHIRKLEEKGLLQVIRGHRNPYGTYTNQYDFSPMYQKINALYAQQESSSKRHRP